LSRLLNERRLASIKGRQVRRIEQQRLRRFAWLDADRGAVSMAPLGEFLQLPAILERIMRQ
jgi:hypothetical protein